MLRISSKGNNNIKIAKMAKNSHKKKSSLVLSLREDPTDLEAKKSQKGRELTVMMRKYFH